MKTIKYINLFAIGLPLLIVTTYPIFKESALFFALISTMLTGFMQVALGLFLFSNEPKKKPTMLYLIFVIIYFVSWYILTEMYLMDAFLVYLFAMPVILASYLTYVIYTFDNESSSFLTAEWNDLAIINYEINPDILKNYIPKGTELDLWNGKCYLSLIGFMFENVRVLGIKIPYHVNFEEVNLRFYVKRFEDGKWKRGVVFIKEIVPKRAISIVANALYKEHYQTLKMRHLRTEDEINNTFQYEWKKDHNWNAIKMTTTKNAIPIDFNSEAEFITEHYYGYTKYDKNKTIEYEVTHPRWHQLAVIDYHVNVDFENIYGKDFQFLQNLQPCSAFLAIGSKITIEGKKTI
jgi:uncharacterized protein